MRHPVTGHSRQARLGRDSDEDNEARTSRQRPKLKAARVGRQGKREGERDNTRTASPQHSGTASRVSTFFFKLQVDDIMTKKVQKNTETELKVNDQKNSFCSASDLTASKQLGGGGGGGLILNANSLQS